MRLADLTDAQRSRKYHPRPRLQRTAPGGWPIRALGAAPCISGRTSLRPGQNSARAVRRSVIGDEEGFELNRVAGALVWASLPPTDRTI